MYSGNSAGEVDPKVYAQAAKDGILIPVAVSCLRLVACVGTGLGLRPVMCRKQSAAMTF